MIVTLYVYYWDLLNENFDFQLWYYGSIKIDNIKSFYNFQMDYGVLKSSVFSDNDELINVFNKKKNNLMDSDSVVEKLIHKDLKKIETKKK